MHRIVQANIDRLKPLLIAAAQAWFLLAGGLDQLEAHAAIARRDRTARSGKQP
jgi:hypothetical protein